MINASAISNTMRSQIDPWNDGAPMCLSANLLMGSSPHNQNTLNGWNSNHDQRKRDCNDNKDRYGFRAAEIWSLVKECMTKFGFNLFSVTELPDVFPKLF